jgi:F-type H+-transporting ATPase subunit b
MNINMTIIGQLIAFIIFVAVCMKYVWPALMLALSERQEKIVQGLAAAERAELDLAQAKQTAQETMQTSKLQAAGIIDQANKRANQIIDEAKLAAHTEASRIRTSAQEEIEQEVNRAKEVLRIQVGSLAVVGAEKILASSIDMAHHQKLLAELAAEL